MFSIVRKLLQSLSVLVLCAFFAFLSPHEAFAGKAGINIGDHFGEVDQAAEIVGDGGWIVVMAQPGDCIALEEMILKYPRINFVIRGHHPSTTVMSPDHAKAWAYTLANMNTGGKKIYFYPINEPFTKHDGRREGFPNDDDTTAEMVVAYTDTLLGTDVKGNLRDKVIFLSPMINRSEPEANDHIRLLLDKGGDDYFDNFDGIAMNLYDFNGDCGYFCHENSQLNAGQYATTLAAMNTGKPVYAVESGVKPPWSDGVRYSDELLVPFYEKGYGEGFFDGVTMTATFSYDPHASDWSIYGSRTAELFASDRVGEGTGSIGSDWSEEDDLAFKVFIDAEIAAGKVARCDECGLSPVTPNGEKFCQGTGKYNLDIFPDYEYDDKDYYLYPICVDGENCSSGQSLDAQLVAYKKSLIEQGYQVFCAENQIDVAGNYSGAWNDYIRLLPVGMAYEEKESLEATSSQVVDYTNLKVPVFRDQSGKRWRMTSIEEFFGFKDIYSNDATLSLLNSGPIEKLMPEHQRCEAAATVLKDAKALCEKENRGIADCALNTLIPDPDNSLGEIRRFDVLAGYEQLVEAEERTCKELAQDDSPNAKKIYQALLQTPLYLERAYRVAFLVTSVRHLSPSNNTEFFNFMSKPYYDSDVGRQYGSKFTEVSIIAFKVPDVGLSHHKDLQYHDPLQLTRDTVLSTKQQTEVKDKQEELQEYFKYNTYTEYDGPGSGGEITGGKRWMGGNTVINCALTPGCGGYETLDPLFGALVDMVNAETGKNVDGKIEPGKAYEHVQSNDPDYEPVNTKGAYISCKPTRVKITPEAVTVIGDSANISNQDVNPELDNDLGEVNVKMMEGLISRLKTTDTNVTRSNFPLFYTDFQETTNNSPTRIAEINTYLIYPGDYEINTVADAIRSPFVPFKMGEQIDENRRDGCDPYAKDCEATGPRQELRLSAIGGIMKFVGGQVPWTFIDGLSGNGSGAPNCDVYGDVTPRNPDDDCDSKSFILSVNSDLQEVMAYPGEKVAFWIKEIQKSLSSSTSNHYAYLESCTTAEQFLLGTCGGGTAGSPSNPGSTVPTGDLPSFDIEYWDGATTTFNPPPQNLWDAALLASSKHGCDPRLVVAVAHSESRTYENHVDENGATAAGTWQFTSTSWQLWMGRGNHQPDTFEYNPEWVPLTQRNNLVASADAACRLILWTGMQRYFDDALRFEIAFAVRGDNPSGQIWNAYRPQGAYVHRLWQQLVERTDGTPMPPPASGYPPAEY